MLRRSVIVLVRAAAVVAACLALDWLFILPFRGNLVLRGVTQRSTVAQSADPQRSVILARANIDALTRAARGHELDPAWYMLYGANCEILGRWPEAADAYSRALRIDDRPEIYVNRGLVYLHLGRTDAAVSDMATAARFNPFVLEQLNGDFRKRVTAAVGPR